MRFFFFSGYHQMDKTKVGVKIEKKKKKKWKIN